MLFRSEFKTGTKVKVIEAGVHHLFNYVGQHGKVVSNSLKSIGALRKYKVLFDIGGIEETAYFLGNEMIKI